MATYKVPQDVEAEDKLLGPFTFKQFIFLIATFISGFLTWSLARISLPLGLTTLPFTVVFGVLGVYHREDQPVEIYLVSLLRFYFKPRRRPWDQVGMVDLVRITAPKQLTKQLTNNLSQGEVSNRLKQLANVMDTRGWSSRNATLLQGQQGVDDSDRLVTPTIQPQEASEVGPQDDPLYEYGQTYETIDKGFNQASQNIKEQAIARMQQQMQVASQPTAAVAPVVTPPLAAAPALGYNPYPVMQQHVISPAGTTAPTTAPLPPTAPQNTSAMTEAATPDILRLSRNNDRNVASIAREAEAELHDDQTISLH